MTATLKLVDAVRSFKGEPSDDLELWLDRFTVALDVTGKYATDKDRDAEMARLMPLFLEGRAYSTWKQLTDVQKADLSEVKLTLRRVYGLSKMVAWKKIKNLRLFPGELVDVLADEISGLLKTVLGVDPPETLVSITLIDAMPRKLAEQVTLLHGEKMILRDVISCAKSLQIGQGITETEIPVAAAVPSSRDHRPGPQNRMSNSPRLQPPIRCKCCGRYGHLIRDCYITCYRCGQRGHYQADCRVEISGNDKAGSASPDHAGLANQH